MSRIGISMVAVVAFSVLTTAFLIAPRACEGGLEIYFLCGVVALIVLAALPFFRRAGNSVSVRVASALGLVILGVAVWVAGLFIANIQIMCRLF